MGFVLGLDETPGSLEGRGGWVGGASAPQGGSTFVRCVTWILHLVLNHPVNPCT